LRKLKIYLETTVFNYYFDEDRDAHADTVQLIEAVRRGEFEAYTSNVTIEELERAPAQKRDKMLSLLYGLPIQILYSDDEAETLTELYIKQGFITQNSRTDALHIAVASTHKIDTIVSLNFQHIAKRRTRIGVKYVNELYFYPVLMILTPTEVIVNENFDKKTRYHH